MAILKGKDDSLKVNKSFWNARMKLIVNAFQELKRREKDMSCVFWLKASVRISQVIYKAASIEGRIVSHGNLAAGRGWLPYEIRMSINVLDFRAIPVVLKASKQRKQTYKAHVRQNYCYILC